MSKEFEGNNDKLNKVCLGSKIEEYSTEDFDDGNDDTIDLKEGNSCEGIHIGYCVSNKKSIGFKSNLGFENTNENTKGIDSRQNSSLFLSLLF